MDLEDDYLVIIVNNEEEDYNETSIDINIKQEAVQHTSSNQSSDLLEESSNGKSYCIIDL